MATQAQMDRLLGKAFFDNDFRRRLIEDPEKAARSLRYRLDPAQAARIRRLDAQTLEQVATEFRDAAGLNGPPIHTISIW